MINLRAHVSSLAVFNDFQETLSVAICIRKKTANVAWDSWETLDADFHINGQERSMKYISIFLLHSKSLVFSFALPHNEYVIVEDVQSLIIDLRATLMIDHFPSRMNVKIMCECWPKPILTHYWFAGPIASSPNAERTRVFARKPTMRPTLPFWLTMESWDWSMNSPALAVVLLTPNTIPPPFSQVIFKQCNFNHFQSSVWAADFLKGVCTAFKMVQLSGIDMTRNLMQFKSF